MKSILGARIRARRRSLKITQSNLASRVGISPSYLNLIEHNKRQIGGALLSRIASELDMGQDELDGASERRLVANMEEIAHLPDVAAQGAEADRASEFIGRFPGWAKAVVTLANASRESESLAQSLSDRLTHDAFLGESVHKMLESISAARSAAEILNDFADINQNDRQQFHQILLSESRNLSLFGDAIATYLDRAELGDRVATPLDEVEALFEKAGNHFQAIEDHTKRLMEKTGSVMQFNHMTDLQILASTGIGDTIDSILHQHPEIETDIALENARNALLKYARNTMLLPLPEFQETSRRYGYDVELLADQHAVSIETVCHRLSSLPESEDHPRFGYMQANAAGTITLSRNLPGLVSPRYGFACPLWALYRAQQSPESVIRQRALFPDGNRYVFLARARIHGASGFGKPRHYLTDMLAMTENDAAHTVYVPDQSVPVERVGVSCRSCPRKNCSHRVSDPFSGQTVATYAPGSATL